MGGLGTADDGEFSPEQPPTILRFFIKIIKTLENLKQRGKYFLNDLSSGNIYS